MSLNPEQIANLEAYQKAGILHEYTCCGEIMRATAEGLRCDKCGRLQTNIDPVVLDGSILAEQRELCKSLGFNPQL